MRANDVSDATEAIGRKFVERFAKAWESPTAEGLAELVHPTTENRYPMLDQPVDGFGVAEYFRNVLAAMPDMSLRLDRWAVQGRDVLIEWTAAATVGGQSLRFSGVDCVTLDGEKEIAASIYFDTQPIRAALEAAQ